MSASPQEFTTQVSEGPITAHLAATFAGLPVYVHSIEHAEGVVLVDTGMIDSTPELDEEGAPVPMPENLPRDVVCVINTHLHFDHIGGNRLFPGVPIHVQRLELQAPYDPSEWVDFPGATYVEHDGEAEVLPGIRLLPTPGHTPGHQSVLVDTPDGLVVIGGDVAYTFEELDSGETEGQRRVLALAAPTWLTHAGGGPKVPRADPAVRFTRINIKKDLEDLGPRFDGAPDLEFRAATKALALVRSALSYQRVPPGYRFPYGHTHVTQEEVYVVVRGSGRMKVGDEVFELEEWDAVRVPPGMWRGYEAGPEGLEILVIGAPNLGEDPREDVEGQRDWWADQ